MCQAINIPNPNSTFCPIPDFDVEEAYNALVFTPNRLVINPMSYAFEHSSKVSGGELWLGLARQEMISHAAVVVGLLLKLEARNRIDWGRVKEVVVDFTNAVTALTESHRGTDEDFQLSLKTLMQDFTEKHFADLVSNYKPAPTIN